MKIHQQRLFLKDTITNASFNEKVHFYLEKLEKEKEKVTTEELLLEVNM